MHTQLGREARQPALEHRMTSALLSLDMAGRGLPTTGEITALLGDIMKDFSDGFAITGADGLISAWNTTLESYTNVPRATAVGTSMDEALHEFRYQTGSVGQPMVVTRNCEGRTFFLYISKYQLPLGGEDCTLYAFHDVSTLVASAETKNQFFSYIAHELRDPIAALQLQVEELEERLGYDDRLVEDFRAAIGQLNSHLSDLATATEMGTPRVSLEAEMQAHMASDLLTFPWMCTTRSLFPTIQIDCLQDFAVQVDLFRTRQIITNLVNNATKYSPKGSPIRIEYGLDECRTTGYLRVLDEGIGVPEECRHHLFEAYYRAPNVRGLPGRGIGLSLSSLLAKQMGGSLSYEPNHPKGSIFTLRFPALTSCPAERYLT